MIDFSRLSCYLLICYLLTTAGPLLAQEDLLALLGEEEPTIEYPDAAFKTNRVINLHSLENTAAGVLDVKISHRFGFLSGGLYDLFGLDNATVRLGADYGLTESLQIGFGRSSFRKTFDGYVKLRLLRQSSGAKVFPFTMSAVVSTSLQTLQWQNPDRQNYFSSRLAYNYQLIIGRKFSEAFSFQVVPGMVHRNLVRNAEESNDVFSIATAGRIKLSRRIALNAEYIYVLPDQLAPGFRNSFSLGFDIETGGHVFQLHFTNSTSMNEPGFITETTGNWSKGDIHFGFNVSRVFTL